MILFISQYTDSRHELGLETLGIMHPLNMNFESLKTQPLLPLWHLQLRLYRLLTGEVGDAFSHEIAAILRWGLSN